VPSWPNFVKREKAVLGDGKWRGWVLDADKDR
jgi:hypothetical protein